MNQPVHSSVMSVQTPPFVKCIIFVQRLTLTYTAIENYQDIWPNL